jgi:CelD/BcsL family acetyltransferase involved in cellulose biosynthesis
VNENVMRLDAAGIVTLLPVSRGATTDALLALRTRETLRTYDKTVSASLRTELDWDAYYESLDKKYRKESARCRRKLAELGEVTFEVLTSGDPRIPGLVRWMFIQKRLWAEQTGKMGAWLYSEPYIEFLCRQLGRVDSDPRNVLMCLMVDGNPVAVQTCAIAKDTLEGIMSAFSAEASAEAEKAGPGRALTDFTARWAWDHKLNFNFGSGIEPYKRFYSRNNVNEVSKYTMVLTRRGTIELQARSAVRRIRERIAS